MPGASRRAGVALKTGLGEGCMARPPSNWTCLDSRGLLLGGRGRLPLAEKQLVGVAGQRVWLPTAWPAILGRTWRGRLVRGTPKWGHRGQPRSPYGGLTGAAGEEVGNPV